MINFEQFQEIDLRVARVLHAESIPQSKNLLKLEIDLGAEKRRMVAGIAHWYKPEDLIEKLIVVVANLEPKTFTIQSDRGKVRVESQGMLLAAENDGRLALIKPDKDMPPGAKIH